MNKRIDIDARESAEKPFVKEGVTWNNKNANHRKTRIEKLDEAVNNATGLGGEQRPVYWLIVRLLTWPVRVLFYYWR